MFPYVLVLHCTYICFLLCVYRVFCRVLFFTMCVCSVLLDFQNDASFFCHVSICFIIAFVFVSSYVSHLFLTMWYLILYTCFSLCMLAI